jgi:hypothetical protein
MLISSSLKGVGKSFSIIDYAAFKYYRETSLYGKEKVIPDYKKHGKVLSAFYKKVGDNLVEASGGVFVKNFGYFSILRDFNKPMYFDFKTLKFKLNSLTDGAMYTISFIPSRTSTVLRAWVFDYNFVPRVKHALRDALKNGKRYNFHYNLIKHKK